MSENQSAWRSPWVIGWIGLIVVVLMVNATMIFLAIHNSPGLVVEDYYERGRDYERHVLSREKNDPGWLMQIDLPQPIPLGHPVVVRFAVVDRAGIPVVPDRVVFHAYRPSDAREDFSQPMEPEAPGRYRATVKFPLKGVWDTLVSVQQGGQEFNTAGRIQVAED